MNRIGRWLLNILTALSLLSCIAAAAFWARAGGGCESITVHRERWPNPNFCNEYFSSIAASRGNLYLNVKVAETEFAPDPHFRGADTFNLDHRADAGGRRLPHEWHGFGWSASSLHTAGERETFRAFAVPLWLAIVGFAALPLIRLARYRARLAHRRLAAGLCPSCGYDLTGNVSGMCPECGTKVMRGSV